MDVIEKICNKCNKVFYTTNPEQKNCEREECAKIKSPEYKIKKYNTCPVCGTQHFRKSPYCRSLCEEIGKRDKERKKYCKKIKCKYMKYAGARVDKNIYCDFKEMTRYKLGTPKPCKY